ncbi:MAG: LytR/AlgR family response regulator transcription factor [Hydrogenophaga sp.]|uniref:LytR/AlgR family response regulator transcription factor n=1 Tax=Hydrogenophaga sp. TaxID=1904254 RepID=UPI003D12187B
MGAIRTVIAEDDIVQAEGIAALVSQLRPSWQVQNLVHDRAQLAQALEEIVPDILLLDLHMPQQASHSKSVLEMVRSAAATPVVILITGDPSKALEAYESAVADYVVKPVRPARLSQALERAEGMLYARRAGQTGLAMMAKNTAESPSRWLSGSRGRDMVMIEPTEIVYLQAERKYTMAVLPDGPVLIRYGITEIEVKLDPTAFLRIHRSTIVNFKRIDFLRRDEMGRLRIHMKGRPEGLIVSRTFEYVFKGI